MAAANEHRLKLLLIAAGCDKTAIGEAWSSFQWISRLGRRHDVTLLTTRTSKKPLTALQLPEVRVVEWTDPAMFERWERFNSMLKPGYVRFYVNARRWLRYQLQVGETFDLVHQISPLALRYPSPAAGLGLPLVLGPLGGSLESPKAFRAELSGSPWYTKLRSMDRWRLRHDPLLRHSYARANRIIGVAPYVKTLLQDVASQEIELMSETGITQLPPSHDSARKSSGQLRLLFVGRVIRSKGTRDAVRAMAKLRDLEGLALDIVGDGDDLTACMREARELGVNDRIAFRGRLPRKEVEAFYSKADVFLFPSFREPSGNVVVEAMSHGLALIVANRGGPGFVVDDKCGFRVPLIEPEQFVSDIAESIRKLVRDPNLIVSMGTAAREKVQRQFLWDVKVDRMVEIYNRVLA